MAIAKRKCPKCETALRFDLPESGNLDVICPECDFNFTVSASQAKQRSTSSRARDDNFSAKSSKRQKNADGKSSPILLYSLIGGGALALILFVVFIVAYFQFAKSNRQDLAQQRPPNQWIPNQALPGNQPNRPQPGEIANPNAANPDLPPGAADPEEAESLPPEKPGIDFFARASSFRAEGALPTLPPLPPVEKRPTLNLDPSGHTAFVRGVFFSNDGTRVISVGEDKSVRFWDLLSGELIQTVWLPAGPNDEGQVYCSAISPDRKRLVVAGFPLGSGKLGIPFYVVDTETGDLLSTVMGAAEVIRSVEFSADGNQLAVGCGNGILQIYDFPLNKWVHQFQAHNGAIVSVAFHPKEQIVASIGADREVKLWSLTKGLISRSPLINEKPNTLDWNSDGSRLGVGCMSGEVFLYSPDGTLQQTIPTIREKNSIVIQIVHMKFLLGDKHIVFGGVGSTGYNGVIDLDSNQRIVIKQDHSNTVMRCNRSKDGILAVTAGGENNEILVWHALNGKVIRRFQSASKAVWAVGWSRDGRSVSWGKTNWKQPDGLNALEQTMRLDQFHLSGAPKANEFIRNKHQDNVYSITIDDFFRFTVWKEGQKLYQHTCKADRVYSVTLVADKKIVVGGSMMMYMIDADTGETVRVFRGDRGITTALAPSPNGRFFVSGSSDHVVRIWRVDRDEPVLSIFSVGREWIAWTPEGYYNCSALGERLISWQISNGIDQLPSIHPASRFRSSLFQPGLLQYLVPAGELSLALAIANQFEKQKLTPTTLADVLPPRVQIQAPKTAEEDEITVEGTAEGSEKSPILTMRLLVDGRPYLGADGIKRFNKQVKAQAKWNVKLSPGKHSLSIMAESPVSKGASLTARVTRSGEELKPNLYVLAIGISDYPGAMKLRFAASDVQLLTSTIKENSTQVFGDIEIKTIMDKQATRKNIRAGLDWLKSKMTAKDVGIVSFSGHGGRDDDTGKFYLIPVDVTPSLEDSCLSGEELKSRLENMPGRLVSILDACHSGAVATTRTSQADGLVRDLISDDYGVIVLASSMGNEYSLESEKTKAGFYTLGLTEGMKGLADNNGDGIIYLNELVYYASLRVQQLSRGRQNPTLGRPATVRPFPIAKPHTEMNP
ncbi:MAG: caspase family protein [Gemmataceae bacterium]